MKTSQYLKGEKRADLVLEIIMIILAAVCLIPIYYMIVTTLKTPAEATASPLGFPKAFRIDGYIQAWKVMKYPKVFLNNLIITSTSVIAIILITSMAGYTIARRPNKFNKIIFFILLAGMMVPYQMAIIPLFKLIKSLNLMNKVGGVILITIFTNVPFGVFLFTGFIKTIPYELEEAARIDGCGVFTAFWRITFPLLRPVIATLAILDTLSIWNDFLTPLLFLQSRKNSVILLEVYRNIGQFSTDWTSFFPMMVLGVAPLLIFYIIMQKNIIAGITTGSIKG